MLIDLTIRVYPLLSASLHLSIPNYYFYPSLYSLPRSPTHLHTYRYSMLVVNIRRGLLSSFQMHRTLLHYSTVSVTEFDIVFNLKKGNLELERVM